MENYGFRFKDRSTIDVISPYSFVYSFRDIVLDMDFRIRSIDWIVIHYYFVYDCIINSLLVEPNHNFGSNTKVGSSKLNLNIGSEFEDLVFD